MMLRATTHSTLRYLGIAMLVAAAMVGVTCQTAFAGPPGPWWIDPTPTPMHVGGAMIASQNSLYAAGGWCGLPCYAGSQRFDLATRRWPPLPPLPVPKPDLALAAGPDGGIYAFSTACDTLSPPPCAPLSA